MPQKIPALRCVSIQYLKRAMPEKLVIRVVNTQSIKPSQPGAGQVPASPKTVVVYHWHRIMAALAVCVAMTVLIVWGASRLRQPVETAATQPPMPTAAAKPPSNPPVQPPLENAAVAAPPPVEIPQAKADTPPQTAPPPSGPDKPASVVILSKNIKRLQLSNGVNDSGPVDSIESPVPMNEKGLVKVFLYMETEGLKGKVLYHDWLWKGRLIAHARIPVRRDQHTAVSSKFIDRIMVGSWEARVVDERGKVLAQTRFDVR